MNEYKRAARLRHVPLLERGAVKSASNLSEDSIALPKAMRTKLAAAKAATGAAFENIDTTTGDGVALYVEKRRELADLLQECEAWLDTSGLEEAEACIERAEAAEDKLRDLGETADELRDVVAAERGRAALLRNSHRAKRGAKGAPARHRPGGLVPTARLLGVEREPERAIVYVQEANKLRQGFDAVDIYGEPVSAGTDYRTTHGLPAGYVEPRSLRVEGGA